MKIKRAHKVVGVTLAVVLVLIVAGLIGTSGCGEEGQTEPSQETTGYLGEGTDGAKESIVAADEAASAPQAGQSEATRDSNTGSLPSLYASADQKVIKSAVMDIEVEEGAFDAAFNQAQLLADRYGGYVLGSNAYARDDENSIKSGQVVISVPAESLERAKTDARQLGTVMGLDQSSENVTEEYVDLQARIKNQQAYVDSIQALLAKAKTIDEILQVQQTLSYAQEQLEQLKGRFQYLEAHTSYSTLSMNIYEVGSERVTSAGGWGFVQALKDAVHNLVDAFSAVVRGLGWMIPVLLILAVLGGIVYATVRVLGKRDRKGEKDEEPKSS